MRDRATAVWAAIVAASLLLDFPAPIGVTVLGMVIGSLIALISIGLVLVYRTNRIINFAQADIGAFAAILSVMLVARLGINYFVAVAAGIAAALLLGAFLELAVMRRFHRAPRLIVTVVTIALAQILTFGELVLPRAFQSDFLTIDFPTPFEWSFRIPDPGGTTAVLFDGNDILAIIAVPLVIAALGAFLKFTRVGVAARASAENSERASLLGIPVKRISTIVWVVAAGLSAVGALLRAPTVGLSITGGAFGPALLVRALAPAVIGRMENLRTTFLSAIALGIVDQAVFFRTSDPAISNAILCAAIFGALLARRRRAASRAEDLDASSWRAAAEVRPIPAELRALPEVRLAGRAAAVVLGAAVVAIGIAAPAYRVGLVSLIFIYAIVGVSLVLLTGWAGQVSLGQFAFAAIGGAVCGTLVADRGYNVVVALLAAGLAGAITAMVAGIPALGIRGLFLAASTLAFALFVQSTLLNRTYFEWFVPTDRIERPSLLGVDLGSERAFYFFVLAWLLLVLRSARSIRRSRTGRVLIGARDNELAARAFGVSVARVRVAAFAISGFYAAIAGGLFVLQQNALATTAFDVTVSLQVFVMVVIGGLGSVPGALLGALYLFGIRFFLSGPASLLASGLGMLALLMIVPGGLSHIAYGWRDALLRFAARRRGIPVPSLAGDGDEPVAPVVPPEPARLA